MALYTKLAVPSFDLQWIRLNDKHFALIPGGGGSTKSGLKNCLQVYKIIDKSLALHSKLIISEKNHEKLCHSISCINYKDSVMLCALYEAEFEIVTLSLSTKDKVEDLMLTAKCFVSDPKISGLNCSAFYSTSKLCTGGDDGIIRIWNIGEIGESMTVELTRELKCSSSISELIVHPNQPWVISTSKANNCTFWNVESGKELARIVSSDSARFKKVEPRSCSFTKNGEHLLVLTSYFLQKSVSTYLIEYSISNDSRGVSFKLLRKKKIGNFGASKLRTDESFEFYACGFADGTVSAFHYPSFKKVYSKICHDLPVTGVCFAPEDIAEDMGSVALLNTCSADYALTTIPITSLSRCAKISIFLMYLILSLVLLFFMLLMFDIHLLPKHFFEDDEEL